MYASIVSKFGLYHYYNTQDNSTWQYPRMLSRFCTYFRQIYGTFLSSIYTVWHTFNFGRLMHVYRFLSNKVLDRIIVAIVLYGTSIYVRFTHVLLCSSCMPSFIDIIVSSRVFHTVSVTHFQGMFHSINCTIISQYYPLGEHIYQDQVLLYVDFILWSLSRGHLSLSLSSIVLEESLVTKYYWHTLFSHILERIM